MNYSRVGEPSFLIRQPLWGKERVLFGESFVCVENESSVCMCGRENNLLVCVCQKEKALVFSLIPSFSPQLPAEQQQQQQLVGQDIFFNSSPFTSFGYRSAGEVKGFR